MSKLNRADIIEAISQMSVMELCELAKELNTKFDLPSVQIAQVSSQASVTTTETVAEKDEFDVYLTSIGSNKIGAIKVLREVTSLGLKEAKDKVTEVSEASKPFIIKEAASKEQAESLKKQFAEIGAIVEFK